MHPVVDGREGIIPKRVADYHKAVIVVGEQLLTYKVAENPSVAAWRRAGADIGRKGRNGRKSERTASLCFKSWRWFDDSHVPGSFPGRGPYRRQPRGYRRLYRKPQRYRAPNGPLSCPDLSSGSEFLLPVAPHGTRYTVLHST